MPWCRGHFNLQLHRLRFYPPMAYETQFKMWAMLWFSCFHTSIKSCVPLPPILPMRLAKLIEGLSTNFSTCSLSRIICNCKMITRVWVITWVAPGGGHLPIFCTRVFQCHFRNCTLSLAIFWKKTPFLLQLFGKNHAVFVANFAKMNHFC